MIELAFVILLNRLASWGLAPIVVTRTSVADADALHGLLSDPANQWRLATAFAEVAGLHPAGDRCDARVRVPLRVRRHASMHVTPGRKRRLLTTEVRLDRTTVAWATWILTPNRATTEVDLALQLESRGFLTRVVLLLGGRRWIARRLARVLAMLATTSTRVAEHAVALPAAAVVPPPKTPIDLDLQLQAQHG